MNSIDVISYSSANLAQSLSNKYTNEEAISVKRQFIYLEEYFEELNVKTILIEKEYVSKAYLSDYAFYYSSSFKEFGNKCKRVHFFSRDFSKNQIIDDVKRKRKKYFNSYLGYIVVKPIPTFIIGPTLLQTYQNTRGNKKRQFFGTRKYEINLLGEQINIETLAFQEQDKVISACATTAIWSMLHKAAIIHNLRIYKPNEITKFAGFTAPSGSRLFPNKGLNTKQMCDAIYKSGLVTEVRQFHTQYEEENTCYLKQIVYAYSFLEIPIILNIEVPFSETDNDLGAHAVTICGYKFKNRSPKIEPKDEISLVADQLDKIYVHDDQWGPFSRISINENSLTSSWTTFDAEERPTHCSEILIPVYPSIRISYDDVYSVVLGIDAVLRLAFENYFIEDFKWDIRICKSNEYKNEIKYSKIWEDEKMRILDTNLPKYIWRAACIINGEIIYEYIFDSSAIATSMYGLLAISYFSDADEFLIDFINLNGGLCAQFEHDYCVDFIEFMRK